MFQELEVPEKFRDVWCMLGRMKSHVCKKWMSSNLTVALLSKKAFLVSRNACFWFSFEQIHLSDNPLVGSTSLWSELLEKKNLPSLEELMLKTKGRHFLCFFADSFLSRAVGVAFWWKHCAKLPISEANQWNGNYFGWGICTTIARELLGGLVNNKLRGIKNWSDIWWNKKSEKMESNMRQIHYWCLGIKKIMRVVKGGPHPIQSALYTSRSR